MAEPVSEREARLRRLLELGELSPEEFALLTVGVTHATTNNTGSAAVVQGEQATAATGHSAAVQGNVGNITIIHNENVTAETDSVSALRVCYLRRVLAECGELKLDAVDREAAGQGGKASLSLKAVYTALLTRTPKRMETNQLPDKTNPLYPRWSNWTGKSDWYCWATPAAVKAPSSISWPCAWPGHA